VVMGVDGLCAEETCQDNAMIAIVTNIFVVWRTTRKRTLLSP